jgi:hypothetical protein
MTRPQARTPSAGRSLAELFPALTAEWDRRNNGADAYGRRRLVAPQSLVAVPEGDRPRLAGFVSNRVRSPGCPFCSHKRVALSTSLAATHPRVARLWHPHSNGRLHPGGVVAGSLQIVWWRCPGGPDHVWKGRVDHTVAALQPCHFCAGRRVSATNSLATLFPKIASEWNSRAKSRPHARQRPGDVQQSRLVALPPRARMARPNPPTIRKRDGLSNLRGATGLDRFPVMDWVHRTSLSLRHGATTVQVSVRKHRPQRHG